LCGVLQRAADGGGHAAQRAAYREGDAAVAAGQRQADMLRKLDVGDEVITTGYAWHQVAHAITLVGATPVLAGAILRMVMGVVVDRLSPKKAAIIGQVMYRLGAMARHVAELEAHN